MGTTENIFVTDLEVFGTPTSGMYFIIVDAESNMPLWNGSEFSKSFNVAEASDDGGFLSGSGMLIVIGLSTLILILLLVVVVLARRGSSDGTYEYEYEYEEEVDKAVVDLPRAGPPSAGPPAMEALIQPWLQRWLNSHSGTKQPSKVTSTRVGISIA